MILVDGLYINNSGGKILLDYLITCLEKTDIDVYYLLDIRILKNHPVVKRTNKIKYLKPNLFIRFLFYSKNKRKFSKILCFGNLPPNIKIECEVFTYFHQTLFIEFPNSLSLVNKSKIQLKMLVLQILKNNTTIWLVQTENIKKSLSKKYNISLTSIRILPFYPNLKVIDNGIRKKYSFVYVSNAGPHKNHEKLLEAFCNFHDNFKLGELGVTIGNNFVDLIQKIEILQKQGYPIINYGFINRNDLTNVYNSTEFLIYPSLAESFGLGIVEAIESNCKVIGADLTYMYAVCEPTLSFNPYSIKEIEKAFEKAVFSITEISKSKISNEIEKLIEILK